MRLPSNGVDVAGKRPKHLEWSVRAAHDILGIDSYLSAENPNAARDVVEYIVRRGVATPPTSIPRTPHWCWTPAQARSGTLPIQYSLPLDREPSPHSSRIASGATLALNLDGKRWQH